jgi:hypothetical protein
MRNETEEDFFYFRKEGKGLNEFNEWRRELKYGKSFSCFLLEWLILLFRSVLFLFIRLNVMELNEISSEKSVFYQLRKRKSVTTFVSIKYTFILYLYP